MVGRNDPCPCGSGKKYKKCCAGKNDVPMDRLVDEELERILNGIFDQMPDFASAAEFERYFRQWGNKLGRFWDDESIEIALSEYFFFVARPDIWKRYLLKMLNTPIRSATRSIVERWQTPFVLLGKVKGYHNGLIEIEEILGDKTYFLAEEVGMSVEKEGIVFGVALADDRNHPNGVRVVTSPLFIQDKNEALTKGLTAFAEASEFEKSADFYKAHLLDVYEMLVAPDDDAVRGMIEGQLTEKEQQVITALESGLMQSHASSEEIDLLKGIGGIYLVMQQPKFRKPNVVAAAILLTVIDFRMVNFSMTQIDIAKLFDVSTSSMTKQAEFVEDFILEKFEEMSEEFDGAGPTFALSVGTDPRITERANWEMAIRMSREDFTTFEEAEENLNQMMHEPFQPMGNKEQAQVFAYDAYDAENDRDRYRLAEKVMRLDPRNIDGLLLKAEIAKANVDSERIYMTAIQFGKMQFEASEDNPWGLVTNRPYMRAVFKYGIWLMNQKKFAEAGSIFSDLLELNPGDNQGARYLAVSSFIETEAYDKAQEILEDYHIGAEEDATYLYLEWYLEACMTEGESDDLPWLLEQAAEENPFVAEMIRSNAPKTEYPRRLDFLAGSIEEAMYIWSLLG